LDEIGVKKRLEILEAGPPRFGDAKSADQVQKTLKFEGCCTIHLWIQDIFSDLILHPRQILQFVFPDLTAR
jgi:hypothetical protein